MVLDRAGCLGAKMPLRGDNETVYADQVHIWPVIGLQLFFESVIVESDG